MIKTTKTCERVYKVLKFLWKYKIISLRKRQCLMNACKYKSFLAYALNAHTIHRRVMLKYQPFCERCGCDEKRLLTIDHIKPLSAGGSNTLGNKQVLCKHCHDKKTKRSNIKQNKTKVHNLHPTHGIIKVDK